MEGNHYPLRDILAQLVLLLPSENAKIPQGHFYASTKALLDGDYIRVIEGYADVLSNPEISSELQNEASEDEYDSRGLLKHLKLFVYKVLMGMEAKYGAEESAVHLHFVALAFLQLFIQLNYTGPNIDKKLIVDFDNTSLQLQLVELLSISGQLAYELMEGPLYLTVALIIFELQMEVPESASLFNVFSDAKQTSIEEISAFYLSINTPKTALAASIQWWTVRALQVRASILPEPESLLSTVSSILLNSNVPNALLNPTDTTNKEIHKNIQMIFYLESARINIHAQTEHLALPLLNKAKQVSQFDFILTGAKAKRTKYQNFYTSSLVVLAKSDENSLYANADGETPETLDLNSELLLEKPEYSNIEDLNESDPKRIKLDFSGGVDSGEAKVLPIAIRKEDIPKELLALDPNDQPSLNDLDNIQLLLRLTTLKQTTPSGDVLVAEELLAVVSRILFSAKNANWSIFSRSLWERSILETTKAKTIERGILQMTSLVEELGVKIKTRVIPEAQDSKNFVASRLRFIHQLPLLSQWQMDVKLAEKYMSIGLLRSAVDIYERLNLVSDAALCYAAVGEEKTAEKMLTQRIQEYPNDARAISILGDVKQDPSLWLRAWEVGKYANSQASLSKYFYGQKNIELAIKHMNICLSVNPLNYENWFFYGCCGLESQQYELASEAFTRCVSLDDTNSHAWSNLALSLLQMDKTRQAFNALQKAVRMAGENKSWRIYENYLIVAAKLGEWNDVLIATRELLFLKRDGSGEGSIDIPVVEKLAQVLMISDYPGEEGRLTHFQTSCIEFICNIMPKVITSSARCWRLIAKVEVWRKRPWAALESYEKAFRAISHQPDMITNEGIWNDAVEACSDLVAAYESFGELPGKHGAEDVVCKDWKYKSRTTIRSLMSKGKAMWEGSEGWERLETMKEEMK